MAIRSFVKIKPVAVKNPLDAGFASIGKGINSLGTTTESVAKNFSQAHELIKFEREWLSNKGRQQVNKLEDENKEEKKTFKSMLNSLKKKFKKQKRTKAEDAAEAGEKEAQKEGIDAAKSAAKGPIKSFLEGIGKLLTNIFTFFLAYGALDWLSKVDGEKITKTFKAIFTIGKFIFNIIGFGINGVFTGLTNLVGRDFGEGPVKRSLRGLLGAFQLIGGIAALRFAQYLLMPWKAINDIQRLRNVFNTHGTMQAEQAVDRKSRINGYRDRRTGVIYTKEEYESNMKAAQRADRKRGKRAGKGMSSNLYESEMKGRFQTQYKPRSKSGLQKLAQKGKIGFKKGAKGLQKNFMKPGFQKGLAGIGGVTRALGGLASGEDPTSAVGAGAGMAAGGILGTAAGTALLGPFLGPFAPMVGNAIGSFLGEWVGKTFAPVLKPLFEPIGRYFSLLGDYVKTVWNSAGGGEWLSEIGELFSTLWTILQPGLSIMWDFIKFVTGASFKVIGETVGWIVNNAKRLMNPGSIAGGVVDFLTFGLTDVDGMSRAKGGEVDAKPPEMAAGGGLVGPQLSIMQAIGGAMLGGVVGGISMLGFAAAPAMAFIGGDIGRLAQLFGTGGSAVIAGKGLGSAAQSVKAINTGDLKNSKTEEELRNEEIQKQLLETGNIFNKMVVKAVDIFKSWNAPEPVEVVEPKASGGGVSEHNRKARKYVDPIIMNRDWAKDPNKDWQKFAAGGEYQNGYLPPEALTSIGYGHSLSNAIAPQFKAMMDAAAADGYKLGTHFKINSSYRTYARQQELYNELGPGTAAAPGTSNHGLGRAVDLWYTDGAYKWLRQNAKKFGFGQIPGYATDDPDGHEAWHWENLTGKGETKPVKTVKPPAGEEAEEITPKEKTETGQETLSKLEETLGKFGESGIFGSNSAGFNLGNPPESRDNIAAINVSQMTKRRDEQQHQVEQMMLKARSDKDRSNFITPPTIFHQQVRDTVINNGGGNTTVTYTKPSPSLTLC